MDTSRFGEVVFATVLVMCMLGMLVTSVEAAPLLEPTPEPTWRALRTDHVKTWHIFNDSQVDGILNPGDTRIETFKNWWTPVSAHTQHNYAEGPYDSLGTGFPMDQGYDQPSSPMNFASQTNGSDNFWLPRKKNALEFYLTYSQYDNNDFDAMYPAGGQTNEETLIHLRNRQRNGWAMGWLAHDYTRDANTNSVVLPASPTGNVAGKAEMDIFIHKGQGTMNMASLGGGINRSNPNVSMSNEIDALSYDGAQWHPPTWDPNTDSYNPNLPANQAYMAHLGISLADFNTIVNSMTLLEHDPNGAYFAANAIDPARTPSLIAATLTEDDGVTPYVYEDAFSYNDTYEEYSSDGGVIAGLLGHDNYNTTANNWADQQVIRIDLSEQTFTDGNITEIVFFDFGPSVPGSVAASDPNQVAPRQIVFRIDVSQTVSHGQIYWQDPADPNGPRIYFPENRIYIAQVVDVPEPATCILVLAGGAVVWGRRRRRRAAVA